MGRLSRLTLSHRQLVADDAARMAFVTRVIATGWLLGALGGFVVIPMTGIGGAKLIVVMALDVFAAAVATTLLLRRRPYPRFTVDALLTLGAAMLTGAQLDAGPRSSFGVYYVVVIGFGFYGLPRRRAVVQFLLVAAAFALAGALRSPRGWEAGWATTIGVAAIVGWVLLSMREALQRSDDRFLHGFEQSPMGMCLVALDGRFLQVNAALAKLFGRSSEELLSMSVLDVSHPEEVELSRRALDREDDRMSFEKRYVRPDGSMVNALVTPQLVRNRSGQPLYFFTQIQDVTDHRRAQERQAAIAALGQRALEGVEPGILIEEATELVAGKLGADLVAIGEFVDVDGDLRLAVRAERGWPKEIEGRRMVAGGRGSMSGYALETRAPVIVEDWSSEERIARSPLVEFGRIASAAAVLIESARERPFGTVSAGWRARRTPCAEEVDFLQAIANTLATAIERARTEERLRHHALHDPLTGLPNRALFMDRLATSLRRGRDDGPAVGVLVLDADRFKSVNDRDGYSAGDVLLAAIGERLSTVLGPSATAARFSGDEFALLLEDVDAESDAVRAAEAIGAAFAQPLAAGGREQFVTFSIGVAVGGPDDDPEQLVVGASAAMNRAKELGRARYELSDDAVRGRVIDRLRLESDMRRALDRDELSIAYQPIVSLGDGRIVGAEALLRWRHPERGDVSPAQFVPLAEDCGLIHRLGRYVLKQALGQAAQWQREHMDRAPFAVSINLSPRQLSDPAAVGTIADALAASGADPAAVSLELTENALMDDIEEPEKALAALKSLGIKVALDDFGTGYSSLGYLRRFRLDTLKVDRSFVEGLGVDQGATAIVRAVVGLARSLDLEVVAEGVETTEQLRYLRALGCSYAQGFLLARPMPAATLGEMIDRDLRLIDASSGAVRPCTPGLSSRS